MLAASSAADVGRIAEQFAFGGDLRNVRAYGTGHINETFVADFDESGTSKRYILQRINHHIFSNVAALMENIARVTRHVGSRLEADGASDVRRRTLTLVPTREGLEYHAASNDSYWRAYRFIDGARTFDHIDTAAVAYQAARAFGEFTRRLDGMPLPRLHETIESFHDTRKRFSALSIAIERDTFDRAQTAACEIAFSRRYEGLAHALDGLRETIPERIVHNDTKLNNVLIDDVTETGICVLDLDTVMPGLALYDFGDMVRSAAMPIAEDARDLRAAKVSLPMFEALTRGYLEGMGGLLHDVEIENLVLGAKVITFECGIRFLADFLQGDTYFRTDRAEQNLDRARVQFALLRSLEEHDPALNACVARVAKQQGRPSDRVKGSEPKIF